MASERLEAARVRIYAAMSLEPPPAGSSLSTQDGRVVELEEAIIEDGNPEREVRDTFYKLAITERDADRRRADRLEAENTWLREALAAWHKAVQHPGEWGACPRSACAVGGSSPETRPAPVESPEVPDGG